MKKKKTNYLAEGEVTGHYHNAIGNVEVFEDAFDDSSLKLNAPQGCIIEHQEHNKIILPPGIYRTGIALEYDPAIEEAKEVRD